MIKSIRAKFYSFIAVLLMILFVCMSYLPLKSSRDAVFEEKKSSLSSQGNAIASSLSRLDRLNEDSIAELLRLLDMSGYFRIVVTDEGGNPIYDSLSSDLKGENEDILTALSGKTVFRSSFTSEAFDSVFVSPISVRGNIIGTVLLEEMDTERAGIIISLQSRVRTVTTVICIVALLLAVIFSGAILRRFGELVNSMQTVAKGDYNYRLNVKGQDELSELGNEFNTLTERLQANEAQRRRFVSDASHELKTPLAAIRLLSDSIVQTENMDSDTMRDFVNDIGNEAERLQRTTEKLLDLSRLDDDVRLATEPVDLKQVVVDAFVFLRPLAEEKTVHIKCDLEDGCIVMGTTDDMYHIVFNLLENAVKYNVENGKVDVALHAENESIILSIKDTGIGIPEEDRLNIFSRFYRVDKARSRASGGSGLGLSIVHDAVLLYGGSIIVGANRPEGSVFTVTFPKPDEETTGI